MSSYRVEVRIAPREGLLDPEGKAVAQALRSLSFDGVGSVHVGRLVRLELDSENEATARSEVDEMCRKLLANPVTEDYTIDVEER